MKKFSPMLLGLLCLVLAAGTVRASDTNALAWRMNQNQVDASFHQWPLTKLLKKISAATGWKVYVEPGMSNFVSAKFKDLPEDAALQRMLGSLNYFRDQTNGVQRLFVFRTISKAATQAVPADKKDYRIANELLVKLKSGASTNSIDQLAKKLGAKVVGRDDRLGFYRLQFDDGSTADAALQDLTSEPSVAAAESNYSVDRPSPVSLTPTGPAPSGPAFNLNPPTVNGPIVGLVDTSIVDLPDEFQKYMMTPISAVGTSEEPGDMPTHGTSMLETMLGSMASNPSMILPVDVYGDGDSTTTYDVMEGIIDAINKGANPINLSLGGTGDSQMMGSLIQEAEQKGIEFVAASGNTPGTEDTYPAAYPGVVAVTASAPNGQLASYADDGNFVQAMEPGTAMVIWNGQEWMIQGTSPATAAATGSIADLENQNHISPQQAATQVIQSHPPPK